VKNSALAAEMRRAFIDLDEVERELKKVGKAIEHARGLAAAYKDRAADCFRSD